MSHFMTALAMKQRGLKPAPKIVLYWLADHYNEQTGLCFPSLRTLAAECEMDKSTLVRHLGSLERAGLIRRDRRQRQNGSHTSTAYSLHLAPADSELGCRNLQNLQQAPVAKRDNPCREIQQAPVAKRDNPCREIQQAPVAKRDTHNLGNNNLGNEQEDGDRDAAAPTSLSDLAASKPAEPSKPAKPSKPKSPPKIVGGLYDGCRSLDEEFERVWAQHPRKVGKGAARSAWGRARSKAPFEEIARPLAVWIKLQVGSEPSFICHFSTWLNEERWLDDQTHALNRRMTTTDRLRQLGASTEAGDDALAGPTRTPPQIELRMDP